MEQGVLPISIRVFALFFGRMHHVRTLYCIRIVETEGRDMANVNARKQRSIPINVNAKVLQKCCEMEHRHWLIPARSHIT